MRNIYNTEEAQERVFEYIFERWLNNEAGPFDPVYIGLREFEQNLGMSHNTVRRVLPILESQQRITITPSDGKRSSGYWIEN